MIVTLFNYFVCSTFTLIKLNSLAGLLAIFLVTGLYGWFLYLLYPLNRFLILSTPTFTYILFSKEYDNQLLVDIWNNFVICINTYKKMISNLINFVKNSFEHYTIDEVKCEGFDDDEINNTIKPNNTTLKDFIKKIRKYELTPTQYLDKIFMDGYCDGLRGIIIESYFNRVCFESNDFDEAYYILGWCIGFTHFRSCTVSSLSCSALVREILSINRRIIDTITPFVKYLRGQELLMKTVVLKMFYCLGKNQNLLYNFDVNNINSEYAYELYQNLWDDPWAACEIAFRSNSHYIRIPDGYMAVKSTKRGNGRYLQWTRFTRKERSRIVENIKYCGGYLYDKLMNVYYNQQLKRIDFVTRERLWKIYDEKMCKFLNVDESITMFDDVPKKNCCLSVQGGSTDEIEEEIDFNKFKDAPSVGPPDIQYQTIEEVRKQLNPSKVVPQLNINRQGISSHKLVTILLVIIAILLILIILFTLDNFTNILEIFDTKNWKVLVMLILVSVLSYLPHKTKIVNFIYYFILMSLPLMMVKLSGLLIVVSVALLFIIFLILFFVNSFQCADCSMLTCGFHVCRVEKSRFFNYNKMIHDSNCKKYCQVGAATFTYFPDTVLNRMSANFPEGDSFYINILKMKQEEGDCITFPKSTSITWLTEFARMHRVNLCLDYIDSDTRIYYNANSRNTMKICLLWNDAASVWHACSYKDGMKTGNNKIVKSSSLIMGNGKTNNNNNKNKKYYSKSKPKPEDTKVTQEDINALKNSQNDNKEEMKNVIAEKPKPQRKPRYRDYEDYEVYTAPPGRYRRGRGGYMRGGRSYHNKQNHVHKTNEHKDENTTITPEQMKIDMIQYCIDNKLPDIKDYVDEFLKKAQVASKYVKQKDQAQWFKRHLKDFVQDCLDARQLDKDLEATKDTIKEPPKVVTVEEEDVPDVKPVNNPYTGEVKEVSDDSVLSTTSSSLSLVYSDDHGFLREKLEKAEHDIYCKKKTIENLEKDNQYLTQSIININETITDEVQTIQRKDNPNIKNSSLVIPHQLSRSKPIVTDAVLPIYDNDKATQKNITKARETLSKADDKIPLFIPEKLETKLATIKIYSSFRCWYDTIVELFITYNIWWTKMIVSFLDNFPGILDRVDEILLLMGAKSQLLIKLCPFCYSLDKGTDVITLEYDPKLASILFGWFTSSLQAIEVKTKIYLELSRNDPKLFNNTWLVAQAMWCDYNNSITLFPAGLTMKMSNVASVVTGKTQTYNDRFPTACGNSGIQMFYKHCSRLDPADPAVDLPVFIKPTAKFDCDYNKTIMYCLGVKIYNYFNKKYPEKCIHNYISGFFNRLFKWFSSEINNPDFNPQALADQFMKELRKVGVKDHAAFTNVTLDVILNKHGGNKNKAYHTSAIECNPSDSADYLIKQEGVKEKEYNGVKYPDKCRAIISSGKLLTILFHYITEWAEVGFLGHEFCAKGLDNQKKAAQIVKQAGNYKYKVCTDGTRFDAHVNGKLVQYEQIVLNRLIYPMYFDFNMFHRKQIKNPMMKAKIPLRRLSGDPWTSFFNCLINCTVGVHFMAKYNIRFLNDGDDMVWFVNDMKVMDEIVDYYKMLGIEVRTEIVTQDITQIEFCQCRLAQGNEGWSLVRNPLKVIQSLSYCREKPYTNHWYIITCAKLVCCLQQFRCHESIRRIAIHFINKHRGILDKYLRKHSISMLDLLWQNGYSLDPLAIKYGLVESIGDEVFQLFPDIDITQYNLLIKDLQRSLYQKTRILKPNIEDCIRPVPNENIDDFVLKLFRKSVNYNSTKVKLVECSEM